MDLRSCLIPDPPFRPRPLVDRCGEFYALPEDVRKGFFAESSTFSLVPQIAPQDARRTSTDSAASPHVESTACATNSSTPPKSQSSRDPAIGSERVQHSTDAIAGATACRRQRRPVTTEHHGRTRVDDYEWLRDKDDPEVTAYLEAENAYTQEQHRPPGRPAPGDLRRDQGPHPRDRPVGADPQPRLLVLRALLRGQGVRRQLPGPGHRPRRLDPAAARRGLRARPAGAARRGGAARPQRARRGPRVLLPRRLVASAPTAPCSPTRPTWSATSATRSGSRTSRTGELLARRDHRRPRRRHLGPRRASTSTTRPSTTPGAPDKVWRHRLGTAQADDELVHHETDGRFWVGVGRTRSDRFLVDRVAAPRPPPSTASSTPTTPTPGFRVFAERARGPRVLPRARRASAARTSSWCCTTPPAPTSSSAPRRSRRPPPEDWQPLIAHDPAVRLEDVDAFAGHLVVHQRSEGLTQLRILELGDDGVGRRLPRRVRPRGLHRRLGRQPRASTSRRSGSATRRWPCRRRSTTTTSAPAS